MDKYLRNHLAQKSLSKKDRKDTIFWPENIRISLETVKKIIEDPTWRELNSLNY